MKRILFILFSAVIITVYFKLYSPIEFNQENNSKVKYTQNERIFFDDFTKNKLNAKWKVYDNETKNGRVGDFKASNVAIVNNQLKLSTSFDKDGSVHSGYITSDTDDNGNNFNYGYYEARLHFTNNNKLGTDEYLLNEDLTKPWGAFWLYPTKHNESYATEIDIVENQIGQEAASSIHPMHNQKVLSNKEDDIKIKNLIHTEDATNYHTYGIAILPNETTDAASYEIYFDNRLVTTIVSKIPLSLQSLHLTTEIATPDYQTIMQLDPETTKNFKNESMYVDYVAVYNID